MIILVTALSSLFFCCAQGMHESQEAAKWATEELNKRLLTAYDQWTLCSAAQRNQFYDVCEKGLLPMVEHLVKMGANPYFAPLIRVHLVKQHYIKGKTALEIAKELNFYEIASLLKAVPKKKEIIA